MPISRGGEKSDRPPPRTIEAVIVEDGAATVLAGGSEERPQLKEVEMEKKEWNRRLRMRHGTGRSHGELVGRAAVCCPSDVPQILSPWMHETGFAFNLP